MTPVFVGLGLAGLATFAGLRLRDASLRRRALDLLEPLDGGEDDFVPSEVGMASVVVDRTPWWIAAGVAIVALMGWLTGLPLPIVIAIASIVALAIFVFGSAASDRRSFRLEEELADAIDLMVSSLRAGVGMLDALEAAAAESREPLRGLLEDALARIRYGEAPADAMASFGRRVPLESFWLFSMTQRVHWEVGGSVARNLAAVGTFIRDRLEMRRLIISQSTQARVSMLFVGLLTYIIGALVWKSNPPRMEEFLSTRLGLVLVSFAVVLQAIGAYWITRLSRIRF